jgi:hypothetical protein
MKILLYDGDKGSSVTENIRAKTIFLSRDERIWKMAYLGTNLEHIDFFTDHLISYIVTPPKTAEDRRWITM